MDGIQERQKIRCIVRSAKVLIGISQDKMKKSKQPQRNKCEMAAHEMEMNFKKKRSKPSHPHTIETYSNAFKRKII